MFRFYAVILFCMIAFEPSVRAFFPVQALVHHSRANGGKGVSGSLNAVSSHAIRPIPYKKDDGDSQDGSSQHRGARKSLSKKRKSEDDALSNLGLPFGLRQVLLRSLDLYKKRIWIVDNSGSMALHDGHYMGIMTTTKNSSESTSTMSSCTRWAEASETVNCHAMLASALHAPTDFRLLNPPKENESRPAQTFRVGYGRQATKDCQRVQRGLSRYQPSGSTPLASALDKIRHEVVDMIPTLQAENQKVAIVIATDGSNYKKDNLQPELSEVERHQEVLQVLKSLQGLPVTVVVRLCTDYGPIVDFYDALDDSLSEDRHGIDIDVLDDHEAEAKQVHHHNPWLNYALLLHRIREMGQEHYLFDVLDERPFTRAEIKEFCTLLFGVHNWPEDWNEFIQFLHTIQQMEKPQINPISQRLEPWIDARHLFVIGCYYDGSQCPL